MDTVTSVSEFVSYVEILEATVPSLKNVGCFTFFRGQANKTWSLAPSLYRQNLLQGEQLLLVFIISLALIITIATVEAIKCIQSIIAQKRIHKMKRKRFIALSDEYKEILVDMLRSPNCSKKLDPTSGNTLYLLNNQFIHQAQSYMFFGPGYTEPMTYTPQPWLIDLFNEEPSLFKI